MASAFFLVGSVADLAAVSQMATRSLKDIRKALGDRCNKVLLMYRKHCAPAVRAGQVSCCAIIVGSLANYQLILPEGFKLLPLYTLCMLKSKALKGECVKYDGADTQEETSPAMFAHITCESSARYPSVAL